MGTRVQLTPLSGAYSEGPLCYLLDVDDFRFLLDCGWDDLFNVDSLQPLASVASSIDAVLLSHPDTLHLGALPYAVRKLGLTAPVYCTLPVNKMGLMYMYDHFQSRKAVSNFDLFNMDDIDSAFQNCISMTYSQHLPLAGKGEGITITPYAAGHLLGGTVWKITKDTEDIIYAVDFNHRKERHLNGTVLESFVRPAVLITDAYNALNNQPVRRQRDQEFVDTILKAVRAGGNVLLPVDTAGRVLELILHLEQMWSSQGFDYPLVFLTYTSSSTVEFAKSLLEWMSDAIAKSFEHNRENVFQLKCFQLCSSRKKFAALDPTKPKVVFASMASLEAGFARELFVEWASEPKNLVLFTERGQALNKITVKNKFPIPGIDDVFHCLQGASFFNRIDLKSGYNQIRVNPADVPKTAFRTTFGLYEFLVMPFGLTNALATFNRMMDRIFQPLRHCVGTFFDDMIVFSKSEAEHVEHLRAVFEMLQKERLVVNEKKSEFFIEEIHFLGPIVSKDGVRMDPAKIKAIQDSEPVNLHEFGTLSRMLQAEPSPKFVKVALSKKVPLSGDELKAYEEEQSRLSKEAQQNALKLQEEESKASQLAGPPEPSDDVIMSEAGTTQKPSEVTTPVGRTMWQHRNIFIDGFAPSPASVAPMFPLHENSREWDEYGEVINPEDFVKKEDDMMDISMTTITGGDPKTDTEAEEMLLNDKPSKVISDEINVQIRCTLQYMDFEGRSDGRSIKTILAHVVPLKLVLVHGSSEATEHLKQHSLKHVPHVFTPKLGETVDVTSDLSAYKVRLTERLMSDVLFRKLGDYELAWVDGEVGCKEDDMLPLLPHSGTPPPHKAVFVGDLKLADFKQLLASRGVQAEFTAGALRCDGNFSVRKVGGDAVQKSQQIVFEGPLSEDYYKMRDNFGLECLLSRQASALKRHRIHLHNPLPKAEVRKTLGDVTDL
ncbi:hypothetical protein L7F22_035319 [Adiantum nelumboides]|nr:hypothetical protein [Adiantum nelumboides]